MKMHRREFIVATTGLAAISLTGISPAIAANEVTAADRIAEFTGGKNTLEGKLTLTTPDIAENGATVPISVDVDTAMEGDDRVESIMILADGNPNPEVITFNFSKMSGEATAKTRIRLAQTQNVTAIAKMADGTFEIASNQVKVTIGGCGG